MTQGTRMLEWTAEDATEAAREGWCLSRVPGNGTGIARIVRPSEFAELMDLDFNPPRLDSDSEAVSVVADGFLAGETQVHDKAFRLCDNPASAAALAAALSARISP